MALPTTVPPILIPPILIPPILIGAAAILVLRKVDYKVEYYENGQVKRRTFKYRGGLSKEAAAKALDIAADCIITTHRIA